MVYVLISQYIQIRGWVKLDFADMIKMCLKKEINRLLLDTSKIYTEYVKYCFSLSFLWWGGPEGSTPTTIYNIFQFQHKRVNRHNSSTVA